MPYCNLKGALHKTCKDGGTLAEIPSLLLYVCTDYRKNRRSVSNYHKDRHKQINYLIIIIQLIIIDHTRGMKQRLAWFHIWLPQKSLRAPEKVAKVDASCWCESGYICLRTRGCQPHCRAEWGNQSLTVWLFQKSSAQCWTSDNGAECRLPALLKPRRPAAGRLSHTCSLTAL